MTWAKTFTEARGQLSRAEASAALCGCPVNTIRDWEQGLRTPPEWVQSLVVGQLLRDSMKIKTLAPKRSSMKIRRSGSDPIGIPGRGG